MQLSLNIDFRLDNRVCMVAHEIARSLGVPMLSTYDSYYLHSLMNSLTMTGLEK